MATTEELEKEILAEMAADPVAYSAGPVNDAITIDGESRVISVPASEILFGVETDKDVERKHFRCPKIVGDGIDLSKHQIYISYITSDSTGKSFTGDSNLYLCEDVAIDGDDVTFSWQLSGNVFASAGFIAFKVLAAKTDGENVQTRWNTVPAVGTVLMTVPDGMDISETYPDIVTQLLERMESVEKIATEEAMQGYVNTYLEAHPADIDETLTDHKKAAPADVVGKLKEEVSDSLGELRYHGKFTSGSKYSIVDTSIAPKKGDLIFFRVDENNSALFSSASLFLYYTDNNYDTVTISKVGDYKFVVAQKDYIKSRIGCECSQADATEPTWSATVMSSEKHSLTGSLMLFYSLLDSGIELRKNDIENLKTDFISKHSKRFVVSKSQNNTYLDFTVDANDKGLIFVSETNATKFTNYDLYAHKPDDTFELIKSNISVVGSMYMYDNNNRYDYLRIIFKCSAPSTSDEYVSVVFTTDTEYTAFGFITRLLGDVDNLKETSATREQIADLDSRMLKSEEIVLFQRNIINVNKLISGKYINNQGDLKDNANYSVTDYEFVEPDTTYTFWRWGDNYQFGQNAFYNKDKKFISYQNGGKKWTTPSNAYYVRMSMPTTSFTNGNSIVCKGTVYTDDTTYQNEYKTVVKHYITREEIAKVNIPDVVESDTLGTLTIEASNSKKNNVIGFEANFSTMGSVRIAHGTSYDANRSASIVVDATNIYLYDKSTNLRATYPHGLTMDKFITVSIVVGQIRTAKIILTTANGRFIQDTDFWGGCREDVTAQAISGTFTNARLTWYVPDYNYDLWAFGDSYFDFWVADMIQNLDYHNFMSDGFGGRGSVGAFKSLKLALEKATPKKILWCLGMNDPDTADAIDANWKNTVDNLINLCDEKGIELILCTIPITPVTEHKYKNAYVKASGKRYVDVCHAVGADISPEWYEGMRTNTETDKIHPTNPLGTRTIADYMLENVPELAN